MITLNSGTPASDPIEFSGGTGVMVWDGASAAQTGTLILERKSKSVGSGSDWTPIGATGIGSEPAQLAAAGTRLFTETNCWLRLRVTTPSGNILCEVARCHVGRLMQD
jgi:hypothetical protein